MAYTDMERRILDMWPKYEDGEYVWIGDDVSGMDVRSFVFTASCVMVINLTSVPAYGECRKYGEPFKRPAPKVLDADGVEIHMGDTVYDARGEGHIVKEVYFDDDESPEHTVWCGEFKSGIAVVYIADQLTHTKPEPPDSWERLEEDMGDDMAQQQCGPVSPEIAASHAAEFVRRAKALAEKEAAR